MDCRAAAHVLSQVATLEELHGASRLAVQGLLAAARTVAAAGERDVQDALQHDGLPSHAMTPDAVAILQDLATSNGSARLEQLQEETPEGLLEMLRIPGLGPARIRQLHLGLQVETVQALEQAARDGRVAALPRFGEKTAEKILTGIATLRAAGAYVLWPHGRAAAARLASAVAAHPDVLEVAITGSIRRHVEVVRDVDLVAAVRGSPSAVAATLTQLRGVRDVVGGGGRALTLHFDDGVALDLLCVRPEQFALALWRTTGSGAHVRALIERAAARGLTLAGDELRGHDGALLPVRTEAELYAHLDLAYCPPELREGAGEVEQAAQHALPTLVTTADLQGALHCHSQYSDGGATITEMADAAQRLGLHYLGISDHSQSNTYAGGLSRADIDAQHAEIDALNATYARQGSPFRLLKGIEADILPCGRLDYDADCLGQFDFVIGSIHTRYGMNERQMTDRVLKALDNPHLTILGHPTGRLLLTREPYAIDMDAVLEKAAAVGVAVELNADPHRLDIDWRACRRAAHFGTLVSIGPDAHTPQGLEHLALGVATARRGGLAAGNILNARAVDAVRTFAASRRGGQPTVAPHLRLHA